MIGMLIAAACQYEVVAIVGRKVGIVDLPTFTRMGHVARHDRWWRILLVAVWGWLTWHVWTEEP